MLFIHLHMLRTDHGYLMEECLTIMQYRDPTLHGELCRAFSKNKACKGMKTKHPM